MDTVFILKHVNQHLINEKFIVISSSIFGRGIYIHTFVTIYISYHNLAMAKCKLKFKKLHRRKIKMCWLEKLQHEEKTTCGEHINKLMASSEQQSLGQHWNYFKSSFLEATDQTQARNQ